MALSDLAVFSEYAYSAMTEVQDQQVQLFNSASENTLMLTSAPTRGDYSDTAMFARIAGGTVRRRNAYGSGAVAGKSLAHRVDTTVKVASGTPPIEIDPSQFAWIQANPQDAGAAMGLQLAQDNMADMLNTAIGATNAALSNEAEVFLDITGETAPADQATFSSMTQAASLFGDRSADIIAWIMHSAPMHGIYQSNLANTERLFTFGTVNVVRDPLGKLLIMTDSPNLVDATTPLDPLYSILGLVRGAATISQNGDFFANEDTTNGNENIGRTYQAEWSYNVGIKGFAWDKANGGPSPTDAALLTATNWDRTATSHKDLAGVALLARPFTAA